MSDDYLYLPIQPASTSLSSHLQALDLLAARLSSLQTRAEWETRVPLNSKASVKGRIVDTGNVKINVGGEWWVDMTPSEGEQWIRRRKAALLEEHAKVLEGWRPGMGAGPSSSNGSTPAKSISQFDPAFRSPINPQDAEQKEPADAMADKPKEAEAVKAIVKESASSMLPTSAKMVTQREAQDRPTANFGSEQAVKETLTESKGKEKEVTPEIARRTATKSDSKAISPQPTSPQVSKSTEMNKSLASVLSQFMENQNALAQAKGTGTMPTGNASEAMINEEGLPIHEIREDENGELLGDLPIPVTGATDTPMAKEEKDDFWSADAVARREALRRKVFDDPSDSESESEDTAEGQVVEVEDGPTSPEINAIPPTPSSPTASSSLPEPTRRPSSSSSTIQPKSILKSSTPRKKSVSFDSSVPVPPDSPATTRIGGSMFPTPDINIETGIEEQAVPMLNAPKRSPNRATFGEPFAGFKPGFLGGGTTKGKIDPPRPVVFNDEPGDMPSPNQTREVETEVKPKKKSLFAQRAANPTEPEAENKPAFPPMSTSTHTSSVKNSIIERPTPSPTPEAGSSRLPTSKDRVEGKTAGVSSTVVERPVAVAGPSRLTSHLPSDGDHHENEEEYDDDDDDDSFYQDDDDEEEYDLDDALLAREVALAYHQNRAYSQLGQQRARSQRTAEDNTNAEGFDESYIDGYGSEEEGDGEGGEGGEGGVVLGLPQISMLSPSGDGQRAMPSIINPTPDDLRRFVRVGKLDNGKLVLAPGEEGWSDEDEQRDGVQERNREAIKAALLGRGGPAVPKAQERRRGDEAIGMPPVIESAGAGGSSSAPIQNVVQERVIAPKGQDTIPNPPKKVSRFKAARMG